MEALETTGIISGLTFGAFFSWIGLLYSYAVVRDWLKSRKLPRVKRHPRGYIVVGDASASLHSALKEME